MSSIKHIAIIVAVVVGLPCAALAVDADDLVESVRIGRHADKTRLVFDVSGAVEYQYQINGNEVILDLAGNAGASRLEPAQSTLDLDLRKTGLTSVSVQALSDGGARIVIVLVQSARVETFDLLPHGDRSYRVVVDVFRQRAVQNGENGHAGADGTDELVGAANTLSAERRSATLLPAAEEGTEPVPATIANNPAVRAKINSVPRAKSTSTSFSGTWEQEWAINTVSGGSQKFESIIEPEWNAAFSNGIRATVIGRIRLDGIGDLGPNAYKSFNYSPVTAPLYNTKAASLVLRELYFDIPLANSYLRLGKQQVVWGESDGIKVLDVVNPQSFREFILDDFDDSRIPLWMVNWEIPLGDNSNLQLLWIPDLTYDELAEVGTPYFVTSPQLVPKLSTSQSVQFLEPDKPNDIWGDSDWGAKLSSLVGNWDVSLQYLYQFGDAPVFYRYEGEGSSTIVGPAYERTHLVGSTLSNTFRDFTVRAELAYKSDTFHISDEFSNRGIEQSGEFSSVLGLDWQASSDVLLSAQWFYSYLLDYQRSIVRDETEQLASLLLQSNFDNASWQLQALGLYSLNNEDMLFQFKLRYWLESNLEIWIGSDVFHGTQRGIFGQFDQQDRVLAGFEYGF